ncbi:hypothetical protein BDV25DRAFT_126920 [Aspergillus avenaceus]|uniref:C2H2-type domain-containing protein n=1 Tax=Aspergillus avenaceus TaxID=36643 RepID=A0A5N6U5M5_ASPAV|nr:hypothetical protein BDV25DRAFT_126920 [Aspergillus avenaceus]
MGRASTRRTCPHCGRDFKRTERLERHKRTHTKEKPYPCHCGSSFSRQDLLARHKRVAQHEVTPATGSEGLLQKVYGGIASEADSTLVGSGLEADSRYWVDFDAHFREFTSFLDSVGLPTELSPLFDCEGHSVEVEPGLQEADNEITASPRQVTVARPETPFSSWLPSAPSMTRIPNHYSSYHRTIDPETRPFKVTEEERSRLLSTLQDPSHLLDPAFCLPSRHALTRYITLFFEGFHSHMPFIHVPTFQIQEHSPELILGIAAIGAQYSFERKVSKQLFFAGKTVLMQQFRRSGKMYGCSTRFDLGYFTPATQNSDRDGNTKYVPSIDTIRTLIVLIGFATWEPKVSILKESLALAGLLSHSIKWFGLEDVNSPSLSNGKSDGVSLKRRWRAWIEQESSRRTRLVAFSFLHTHSIAYDVYPTLRSNEVDLRLPCSTKEWKARTAALWHAATKEIQKPQLYFREALALLLQNRNGSSPLDPIPTPLGNYVLLHGLLQRIHIVRDLNTPVMRNTAALPTEEVEKLERGLRAWTSGWQQAPESSLDPNNENGPIPFTSSSFLALAYVRIYLHLGPYRALETRDPARIANAIASSPSIERSDGIIAALLYATHMFSIPVRLGVERVARSQAFFWSVRHLLSNFECAILLNKWLAKLADTMSGSLLTESEDRIMSWVRRLVEEAYTVIDFDEDSLPVQHIVIRNPADLSLCVLKISAHFFKSNTQWPFINIIGSGLEMYCRTLVHDRQSMM